MYDSIIKQLIPDCVSIELKCNTWYLNGVYATSDIIKRLIRDNLVDHVQKMGYTDIGDVSLLQLLRLADTTKYLCTCGRTTYICKSCYRLFSDMYSVMDHVCK